MQAMMKDVVCEGTATRGPRRRAVDPPARPVPDIIAQPDGGYDKPDGTKAYYASFVGFLPAEDPQVTILVSVEEPPAGSGDRFGGTAAASVFRQLAPTMIHELDISQPPGSAGWPR